MTLTEDQIEHMSHCAAAWAKKRRGRGRHTYEELRQEARVAIWEAANRYDQDRGGHIRGWCMMRAIGHLKTVQSYTPRRHVEILPQHAWAESTQLHQCEIDQAISRLPVTLRTTITYFYVGGMTLREVAKIMGRSLSTVHNDRELALSALKEILSSVEHLEALAG